MEPSVIPHKRSLELDGLRAFAILPVLMFHFKPTTGALAWLGPLCNRGWIGVELFFVLSGYLITGILVDSAGKPGYYKNFIMRRALRVLPLYYLYLAVTFLVIHMRPNIAQDVANWGGLKWYAFYVGNIRMAMQADWPPFRPLTMLWSLQVEEQFYLFYPLLIACCKNSTLRRILWFCVVVAPALRCLTLLMIPHGGMTRYVLTPLRVDSLAAGGIVALLVRQGGLPASRTLQLGSLAGVSACTVMFLTLGRLNNDYDSPFVSTIGFSLVDLTCALVLAFVVSSPKGRLADALRWAPLVYIGQISYGLYLFHYPVGMVVRSALGRYLPVSEGGTLNLIVSVVLSIVLAGLSWRFFESRVLRLKDRFSNR